MDFTKEIINFEGLSRKEIKTQLADLNIPLSPNEVIKIQKEMLGRAPSLSELILFSIQGSEHCSYKSSRTHLKQFVNSSPDVVLGAKEDAGVVSVATDNNGNRWCIVMSHESHNHPSQIVPYEGAATGVGGNVRDVMCMGAEVIACTNSLRFGEIKRNKTKWIQNGVVSGIAGYGNPIGVPTIGGDIYYNKGYNENCLVTLVTLGIVRENDIIHSYAPKNANGYDLIIIGKPTDNSGFGGASFASLELEEEKKEKNKGAVQEPNAFLERHLLKATYALFDIIKEKDLVDRVGFKDLGAGGVACASVELAETSGYGSEVWLDNVHVGIKNLHPSIYLCSETQERFMWVVPPEVTPVVLEHYNQVYDLPGVSYGSKASVIGKIRDNGQFVVHYKNETIVNAKAEEVTKGFLYDRKHKEKKHNLSEPFIKAEENLVSVFFKMLAHENIASREPVYETYDKQVQGRSVLEAGKSDAGVLAPFNSIDFPKEIRSVGIALSTDQNPRYCEINPYWGGVNAVVESMRNVAATGSSPHAISDCLCFGNPEKPNQMWEFVEAVRGIADACKTITLKDNPESPTPIIAGNVSFYNESKAGAIPPSPIVSCLGKIEDVSKTVFMGFKGFDSDIFMIGPRKNELGGSLFYELYGELGENVPKPNLSLVKKEIFTLLDCIELGLVEACHDISDGGVAICVAEMCFANKIGCDIKIPGEFPIEVLLFSETSGFIFESLSKNKDQILNLFLSNDVPLAHIGKTKKEATLDLNDEISVSLKKAHSLWKHGLRSKF